MTPEKTPPVSEGWPTPEEIVDEKRDCLLAFKCQFTHEDAASKQMRILFAAAWAVENRPKLEALTSGYETLAADPETELSEDARDMVRAVARELRALLTKEPQ